MDVETKVNLMVSWIPLQATEAELFNGAIRGLIVVMREDIADPVAAVYRIRHEAPVRSTF